jgi:hypothetical protein
MDKTSRIKELVKTSLNSSFGGGIIVKEMIVLPTQKFNEKTSGWDPDSFAVFLSIEDKRTDQPDYYHFVSDDPSVKISSFLESLLGFEVCVDFV